MTAYHGGKFRHGKQIAEIINEIYNSVEGIKGYIEPFCGMCGVYRHVVNLLPKTLKYIASDQHDSLILMWKALQDGWVPPKKCSIAKFNKLKYSEPSPEKAYFGFGTSFGGIYFCGHRETNKYTQTDNSERIVQISKDMKRVKFYKRDYQKYTPGKYNGYIIYCDPPYSNTDNNNYYDDVTFTRVSFNTEEFWEWCRELSKNNIVIISQYSAPKDFKVIYTFNSQRNVQKNKNTKLEHLYIHKSNLA